MSWNNLNLITLDNYLERKSDSPSEHGLSNSERIIPSYYKIHDKRFNIDYLELIKDDVRNCRKLSKYQMEYIQNLTHLEKNCLLELYNECIGTFNDIIN